MSAEEVVTKALALYYIAITLRPLSVIREVPKIPAG